MSKEVEIRVRAIGRKRVITLKGGYGLRRTEVELEISAAKFRAVWPLTRAARIAKRRYRIKEHSFRPPAWFGREVTGDRKYANAILARLHRLPRGFNPA